MSDTKIQINCNRNKSIIQNLERLYRQEKAILIELKFIENWKREGRIYVSSYGSFNKYDIDWAICILKSDLRINHSKIRLVRSGLVIC